LDETSDPNDPSLLTVADFVTRAADRGKRLWTQRSSDGMTWITDGSRTYVIPDLEAWLPASLVGSLCRVFDLPLLDFALDPGDEA